MRDASRLAARQPGKGGLRNVLFVLAAAESLPAELNGRVNEVQVTLPWGSLLHGAARGEPWLIDALYRVLRTGARIDMLLSVNGRDAAMGVPMLDAESVRVLAARYAACGFAPVDIREATLEDVQRTGSGWARRLDIPRGRPAWRLLLQAPDRRLGTTEGEGTSRCQHRPVAFPRSD
jgi:hypothetical protein